MLKFLIDEDMPRSTARVLRDEVSTSELNHQIIEAFGKLTGTDLEGSLIMIEPGRIRMRKDQR
jgi:hypothetical protein